MLARTWIQPTDRQYVRVATTEARLSNRYEYESWFDLGSEVQPKTNILTECIMLDAKLETVREKKTLWVCQIWSSVAENLAWWIAWSVWSDGFKHQVSRGEASEEWQESVDEISW